MRWLHDAHRGVPSSVVLAVDKARSADFSVHPSSCTSVKKTPLPPRRSSIARSAITGKRARIRPKKRSPSEFARIYGSKARVAWVKAQPCIAAHFGCGGAIQNAHIVTGGMGRKADARWIVPLCGFHHDQMHRNGARWFTAVYYTDLPALAAETDHRWALEAA